MPKENIDSPKLVTVATTNGSNPTVYLTPEPITFKGGKADIPESAAKALIADRGNIDHETKRPLFVLA